MRTVRPVRPSVRALVALSVVLAVALAALVAPAWSLRVVAVVQAACAAVGAVVLLRRPRAGLLGRSWAALAPWGTVVVVAALVPVELLRAASGGAQEGVAVYLVVTAVMVLGAATTVPLAVHRADTGTAPARSTGRPWVDAAMVTLGTAAVATLALRASPGLGLRPAGTLNLVVLLVLLAVSVWLRGTRVSADPAVRGLNTAVLLLAGHEALFLLTPGGTAVLPVLAACAAALGSLVLVDAGCRLQVFRSGRAPRYTPSPGSARVVMTAPFAIAVPATGALSRVLPGASIPASLLWGAVAAMTVLALVRAHALVSAAESDAERDALTGLHDRRGFVRAAQEEEHRLGGDARVCLVDLDGFKLVNDRRGHAAGDALLRAIADRLRARLPVGSVVARLGGDELVALVHATSGAEAAQRVLDVFVEPFDLGSHGSLLAAASVGVADHGGVLEVDEVLKRADIAMYTAKHEGRGRWVAYCAGQREKVLGASVMLEELRTLLTRPGGPAGVRGGPAGDPSAEDPGRLLLHYQPVVDLVTGDPVNMECFVRWQHPRRGLVPPDDFLPLVESAGLGADVDRWVLHTALEQLAAWDAVDTMGTVQRVGVNLGVSSLRSPSLIADVDAALAASGCGPQRLLLEITEHDELPFDPAAAQRLLDLRERGVSVALDDFGNGYSSVGYLRRWPVNAIKLDRSLLPAAGAEGAFAAIDDPMELLDGVVALAAALGHDIVAEGVETVEDDRAVRAVGVRYGQGWLYARPMDAEGLLAWWCEHAPAPVDDGAAPGGPLVRADDHAGAVAP